MFEPALRGRSTPANRFPAGIPPRSKKHGKGWNPNVFHVAAAVFFSLCATVMAASKSNHSLSGNA